MASKAAGILKSFEDRMSVPFGTPAAAAWTAIFVLIGVFAIINYGVGMVLDAVLHPAPEAVSAPIEPAGEPASVVVDLPPPLTPKVVPAAMPKLAAPAAVAPRRSSNWDSRRYRHGWGSRHWRKTAAEPGQAPAGGAMLSPHPSASHASTVPLVRIDGLPKHIIDGGSAMEKIAKPATPAPTQAAAKP
jgi:hypothetical protein